MLPTAAARVRSFPSGSRPGCEACRLTSSPTLRQRAVGEGFQERGRVRYKGDPLVYYELLLE
jgi:hypothetical protein